MRVRRLAVCLVATVLLAPACSADRTTTKAQFVRDAEAVSREANAAARSLGPEPPIFTPAHASWIAALTQSDNAALDRLQALDRPRPASPHRPSTDRATRRARVRAGIARASRRGEEAAFRAAVDASVTRLDAGRLAASDYGLEECSQLGLVTRGG